MTTILVVDDDQTFTKLLQTVFELEGYQTATVKDTENVIPSVHQVKPTLILMDVHIAQADTLDILRELKTDETSKSIPIIMTSGMDRSAECLEAGANRFIFKPFRPSELLEIVTDLI